MGHLSDEDRERKRLYKAAWHKRMMRDPARRSAYLAYQAAYRRKHRYKKAAYARAYRATRLEAGAAYAREYRKRFKS